MKRITSVALLFSVGLLLSAPPPAHGLPRNGQNAAMKKAQKDYKKYSKQQEKLQKKQLKAQKKQLKKWNKEHGNTVTTVT